MPFSQDFPKISNGIMNWTGFAGPIAFALGPFYVDEQFEMLKKPFESGGNHWLRSEQPRRKKALDAQIAKWKRARDASCEKSTRNAWDDGSMRPAARAICATEVTKEMTKRLSAGASRKPS
ncbi:lysozyme inhibitor LprI family protein [Burkholderia anthina]|uniref:lysozyme inhibitor LprI family protein n=1 Tax=Burkholderia anthina TaxID=179879 RepID=UPI0037BFBF9E